MPTPRRPFGRQATPAKTPPETPSGSVHSSKSVALPTSAPASSARAGRGVAGGRGRGCASLRGVLGPPKPNEPPPHRHPGRRRHTAAGTTAVREGPTFGTAPPVARGLPARKARSAVDRAAWAVA